MVFREKNHQEEEGHWEFIFVIPPRSFCHFHITRLFYDIIRTFVFQILISVYNNTTKFQFFSFVRLVLQDIGLLLYIQCRYLCWNKQFRQIVISVIIFSPNIVNIQCQLHFYPTFCVTLLFSHYMAYPAFNFTSSDSQNLMLPFFHWIYIQH